MTTKLLLTGGRQRARAHFVREWNRYNEALVIELDLDSGLAKPWLRYETPSELTSLENPSIVFKSGCLVGDRLTQRDSERVGPRDPKEFPSRLDRETTG